MTQKQRVINEFKRVGFVTNFWAISNSNRILRLASVISRLRADDWDIKTEYKGVVGDKNCHYILNQKPTRTVLVPSSFNEDGTVTMTNKQIDYDTHI